MSLAFDILGVAKQRTTSNSEAVGVPKRGRPADPNRIPPPEYDENGKVKTGPAGGKLEIDTARARRADLNAEVDPETGLPRLHRGPGKEVAFTDTATVGRLNEQPWYRMAAFMLLHNCSLDEIASAANVHPSTVRQLKAQRWFTQLLATLANEAGQDITALFNSEAAASVQKLVDLRDTAESERVQLAAALALVEHARGKPTQYIKSEVTTRTKSPAEELRDIEEELRSLREKNSMTVPAVVQPIQPT